MSIEEKISQIVREFRERPHYYLFGEPDTSWMANVTASSKVTILPSQTETFRKLYPERQYTKTKEIE